MTATEWRLTLKDNVLNQVKNISAGADEASGKFSHLQSNVNSFGNGLTNATGLLGGMKSALIGVAAGVVAAFSIHAISEFASSSVEAYNESAQNLAQLQATITSTGNAANVSIRDLISSAEEMQRKTLFDDDAVIGAQSLLLTFTKVRGEMVGKATPAILDMATKLKTDLNGAALQVGKALNDPIKGINALRRSGISFTQEQIAGIEKLQKAGKLQEAQLIVLNELQKEFGGSAEAAANSGTGFLTQFGNQWGDIKEKVGAAVVEFVQRYKPQIESFIQSVGNGVEWIIQHAGQIKDVFVSLAEGIATAALVYGSLVTGVKVYTFFQGLSNGATSLSIILTEGWTLATQALNAAWKANPLGIVAAAIGLITAGIMYAWKTSEGFRGFLYGLWDSIKQIFTNISNFFKQTFSPIFEAINAIKEGRIADAAKAAGKALINLTPVGLAVNATKFAVDGGFTKGVGAAYDSGYKKGVDSFKKDQQAREGVKSGSDKFAGFTPAGAGKGLTGPTGDFSKGLKEVSDGGKSNRIINVTINKLVDGITVNAATIKESSSDIVSIVQDAIIRALSGAEEAVATNG